MRHTDGFATQASCVYLPWMVLSPRSSLDGFVFTISGRQPTKPKRTTRTTKVHPTISRTRKRANPFTQDKMKNSNPIHFVCSIDAELIDSSKHCDVVPKKIKAKSVKPVRTKKTRKTQRGRNDMPFRREASCPSLRTETLQKEKTSPSIGGVRGGSAPVRRMILRQVSCSSMSALSSFSPKSQFSIPGINAPSLWLMEIDQDEMEAMKMQKTASTTKDKSKRKSQTKKSSRSNKSNEGRKTTKKSKNLSKSKKQ